jgi:cytochrome c-type biogenesis protein CcmH/NrfG
VPALAQSPPYPDLFSRKRFAGLKKGNIMSRLLLLLFISASLYASGGGGGGNQRLPSSPLQAAQLSIEQKNWSLAISQLQQVIKDQPDNADAWNLLGYSQRKSGQLEQAFESYQEALRLNPQHLGAHEYLGEAFLQAKKPEEAKKVLAKLGKLCQRCEEFEDLSKALALYSNDK